MTAKSLLAKWRPRDRLPLISDLHGNLVALRAVLQALTELRVDRTVCLGDVATLGPAPGAVLAELAEREIPCLRGNHDDFLITPDLIERYTDIPSVVESVKICRDGLTKEQLDYVATFPEQMDVDLGGCVLSLFHGSPRSNMEDLLATTTPETLDAALGLKRAPVMAGGHTHIQMLRQHDGTLLVNPGSVGLAFRNYASGGPPVIISHAEFAIIDHQRGETAVSLHRVPLERRALRQALRGWDAPLRLYLEQQYEA